MKSLLISAFVLLFPIALLAQTEGSQTDSTDRWDDFDDENYEANWDIEDNFKYGFFGRKNAYESNKPTIDAYYGMIQPEYDRDEFESEFAPASLIELRLGIRTEEKLPPSENIHEYEYNYLSVIYGSQDIGGIEEEGKLKFNTWVIGLANQDGYGYRFSESSSLTLFNSEGITFTINDFDDNDDTEVIEGSAIVIDKFSDDYHFGENFEAGMKLRLFDEMSINAGYERNSIYRRHMFWYWVGSKMVQGIADSGLNWFIGKVEDSSPAILPIVHFILKNGLDFAFYELKKSRMNWPIETEEALMYDQFKVGISFNL